MPQAKQPDSITGDSQHDCNQRAQPRQETRVTPQDMARRIERGEAIRNEPRQDNPNRARMDRQREARKFVGVENDLRHRNRLRDPEGRRRRDEIQREKDHAIIHINAGYSRRKWMIELCDVMLEFYPREIGKIRTRVDYFKRVKQRWQNKTED